MSNAHPSFKAVAESIARRGNYSEATARKIAASAARNASAAAKKANPRLDRVKG